MTIRPPTRVTIDLEQDVGVALVKMCEQDLRYPKQQLAWIVRQEAQRRGLLTNSEETGESLAASPVSSVRTA